ncbi:ABC transporter ATP-binding protein [Komagataeibacter swingsii]|uniref:Peptide ABC transporter ATP-binding protein n=1 Tax=Komagataeibacter swingsii TaxID=215220 RepID=A0A2V4RGK3_9PROT|nr:ABC transporter ATP-binding protein [Komagataeibacter swingsii]PYD69076.1 peptide ABC transporter ATP-binding protein [Komagataeibacter swingsii]GBQ65871.1 peptide ABC transporter ATP-binding protein [Komagataeibacter swingsii DSM 16373]
MTTRDTVLEVDGLSVGFGPQAPNALPPVIEDVSFSVRRGEIVCLVGESSSGKSVTSLALMGLLPPSARITGEIMLHGREAGEPSLDLLQLSRRARNRIRGHRISMVFQDPMNCLDPIFSIGNQLVEILRWHNALSRVEAWRQGIGYLHAVGINQPDVCMKRMPHELSGGMRQRVMIAMALAGKPELLIADEPTTALDVTVQAQVLDLLLRLRTQTGMSVIFITHNLAVASRIADRIIVMYAGQIVENSSAESFFTRPAMPYSRALLDALPTVDMIRQGQKRLKTISGNVPGLAERPAGCRFFPRCVHGVAAMCDSGSPVLQSAGADHLVRCRRWEEISA